MPLRERRERRERGERRDASRKPIASFAFLFMHKKQNRTCRYEKGGKGGKGGMLVANPLQALPFYLCTKNKIGHAATRKGGMLVANPLQALPFRIETVHAPEKNRRLWLAARTNIFPSGIPTL